MIFNRIPRRYTGPVQPGTVIHRGQRGGLETRSEGIHWSTNPDTANKFADSTGHVVSAIVDDPSSQLIQEGSLRPTYDYFGGRRNKRSFERQFGKDGSLSSEGEVRVRPGTKLHVINIHQFGESDDEGYDLMGPHHPITIKHMGINHRYRNLPVD